MYNLEETLKEVSHVVDGTDYSVTMDTFMQNYQIAQGYFKDQTDWVRFDDFDTFKEAITALVCITMIYIFSKTGSVDGVAENTGFTTDFTCAYSWWNSVSRDGVLMLDGKQWDYDVSFIEVRQSLGAGEDWYEIRIISQELVHMQYDKLAVLNA